MTVIVKKRVVALYVDSNRENARAVAARVGRGFEEAGYLVSPVSADSFVGDAALLVTIGGD